MNTNQEMLARLRGLPARLAEWEQAQEVELEEFIDRNEAPEMQGSLDALRAIRAYIETGKAPLFMTLA